MERHAVIGTAGHVDHGKTALVKALTGIDTDRWEEEKRRGITIDIGFAHFRLNDKMVASVVDVPGHEDFVRNMVAGATGVDVALLVVAADEGIMPQTIEHLAILEFLGVATGVVAVTKVDLAEPEWLELVVDDIRDRLEGTTVQWEPPQAVSVKTGVGLDELAPLVNGRTSVVAGPSGVGKSSLLNRLIPGLDLRVGEVSAHNEKGRHITTRVTWHPLPTGGAVIDTPGFRDYALWNLPPAELGALMPDIAAAAGGCRFSNCLHRTEPSCAVQEAVDGGAIHPRRFESYLYILDTL